MEKTTLPSNILQPQLNWHLSPILTPVFNLLNYFFKPEEAAKSYESKSFRHNESFWNTILNERIRAHQMIELKIFICSNGFLAPQGFTIQRQPGLPENLL